VTAKSSDSFKVNENSKNDLKTKNNEDMKDKREEKREKRPEITINDVKKPDLSTLKRGLYLFFKFYFHECVSINLDFILFSFI